MDPRQPASSSDTLHGWKEIAAYVGKSVRAAQRWERDLGLPVRRLKTPHSQIIFASRREIDAWRRRIEIRPGEVAPPAGRSPTVGPTEPVPASGPPARGLIRFGALWVAFATLGVLVLLLWFWR